MSDDLIYATWASSLEIRERDDDQRLIFGRVAPYGELFHPGGPVAERFRPGCMTQTINRRGDKIAYTVGHGGPAVGRAVDWQDQSDGMFATFKISETRDGDDALTYARDGVVHSLSVGFRPARQPVSVREGTITVREQVEINLDHVAGLSGTPAYAGAQIVSVREEGDLTDGGLSVARARIEIARRRASL